MASATWLGGNHRMLWLLVDGDGTQNIRQPALNALTGGTFTFFLRSAADSDNDGNFANGKGSP